MSTGRTPPTYYETHFTDEEGRFLVDAPAEIVQILRSIRDRGAMLTAYFGDDNGFTLTSVLEVAPEEDQVLFDMPAQRSIVPGLLASNPITLTAVLDGIRIKFQVDGFAPVVDGDREVLAARLPDALSRLQRREFFRVGCPMANPPRCVINYTARGQAAREEFDVVDVSLGGLALVARQHVITFEPGNEYKDCTIALPGEGALNTGLEVRNVMPIALRSGEATRVGCRFFQAQAEGITRLQRYTMRIERERLGSRR